MMIDLLHGKMRSDGQYVLAAVFTLLKLITLALFGLILVHPKVQLVPRSTFKILSKLVFTLFLPCLIFTYLGESITLKNVTHWWFIPVNVLISTSIGAFLGFLVVLICRPPKEFVRFTIVMTAFGNTGNISIAILDAACGTSGNPFGDDCYENGIAYVSIAQWISVILVYTLVYHMMEPPLEYYEIDGDDDDQEIEEIRVNISGPLLVEAEWPGMENQETEHCKTAFIARVFSTISDHEIVDENGGECSPKSSRCVAEPNFVRKITMVAKHTPIHRILQPSTVASLLAVVIGLIPTVKAIIYGDNAAVEVITDSLSIISEATVPSVMLILGGMIGEGPNESSLGIRTTIGIIVARLLVLPVIGFGVIYLASKWNLLISGDNVYQFVLLLQYTTPSAILLGAIASLRGYAVKEASAILFWQHVVAIVTLSVCIIVYFSLLVS